MNTSLAAHRSLVLIIVLLFDISLLDNIFKSVFTANDSRNRRTHDYMLFHKKNVVVTLAAHVLSVL